MGAYYAARYGSHFEHLDNDFFGIEGMTLTESDISRLMKKIKSAHSSPPPKTGVFCVSVGLLLARNTVESC